MDRATIKINRDTAGRLSRAKLGMSDDIGYQLNTSQAIDYLLAYWQLTRNQAHLIELGADGVVRSPLASNAQPA